VILPSTAMLTVAVVYNRYHYISDSLAGLATAGVCYGFCVWFFKRVGAPSRSAATQPVREDSGALTTA
jgi:membrane-associated phospholipid phosphatase